MEKKRPFGYTPIKKRLEREGSMAALDMDKRVIKNSESVKNIGKKSEEEKIKEQLWELHNEIKVLEGKVSELCNSKHISKKYKEIFYNHLKELF